MSSRYKHLRERATARAVAQIDGVLKAEYEGNSDPVLESIPRIQILNGLYYCLPHGRDVCHDCKLFSLELRNFVSGFKIPPSGVPDLPFQILEELQTDPTKAHQATLVARRWLWMQKVFYTQHLTKQPVLNKDNVGIIRLPFVPQLNETLVSKEEIRQLLLPAFEAFRGIAGSQRYQHGIQSSIMITDFETFEGTKEVLEEGFATLFDSDSSLKLGCESVRPEINAEVESDEGGVRINLRGPISMMEKAKFHILNVFGFLLENRTIHSFWRIMELTAASLVEHVKNSIEDDEEGMIMTEKARNVLLQLTAQLFWALLYSQHHLHKLRNLQHQVSQKDAFPFYKYSLRALEADLDINLIVLKLSTVQMWNIPLVIELLQDLRLGCQMFPEQVTHINSSVMAALDELAARFEAFRLVLNAAQHLHSEAAVRLAFTKYRFDVKDKDLSARQDELLGLSEPYRDVTQLRNPGLVGDVPILSRLLSKENRFRRFHAKDMFSMFEDGGLNSEITEKHFESLRARFFHLFPLIVTHWAEDERSLLSLAEVRRLGPQESSTQKKEPKSKRVPKQKRRANSAVKAKGLQVETSEDETVLFEVDHERIPAAASMKCELFWPEADILSLETENREPHTSPGSSTNLNSNSSRAEHISGIATEHLLPLPNSYYLHFISCEECNSRSQDPPSMSLEEIDNNPHYHKNARPLQLQTVQRCLDSFNTEDMRTRDILWGKVKGTLKWIKLMRLLFHIGCTVELLLGNRRRVIDHISHRCAILFAPHGRNHCRPHETQTYRVIVEKCLIIQYEQLITPREKIPL